MKITVKQLKQLIKEQVEEVMNAGLSVPQKPSTLNSVLQMLQDNEDKTRKYIGDGDDAYGRFELYYRLPLTLFTKTTNLTPEDVAANSRLRNKIEIERNRVNIYS